MKTEQLKVLEKKIGTESVVVLESHIEEVADRKVTEKVDSKMDQIFKMFTIIMQDNSEIKKEQVAIRMENSEIRREMAEMKTDSKVGFAEIRTEMAEMKIEMKSQELRLVKQQNKQLRWMVGAIIGTGGLIIAAIKFF